MCLESESEEEPVHLWCWGSLAVQKLSLTVKLSEPIANNIQW